MGLDCLRQEGREKYGKTISKVPLSPESSYELKKKNEHNKL
jgi:hypothetical protein